MKKRNIKPLVLSALASLAMGAVGTVGTFALFTDKAETKVEVESGIVDIDTKVSLVRYESSVDDSDIDLTSASSYVNNLVGSSFALNGNQIVINRMVPGDALTIKVKNINKSNVRTKTRFVAAHGTLEEKKDLFPALDFSVTPTSGTIAELVKWKSNEASVDETGAIIETELNEVEIRIEFTNIGTEITSRDKGANNAYQDAACTIGFAAQAVQGNAETNIIDEINTYLNIEGMIEGKNKTMYDAVVDVRELGYDLVNLQDVVYSVDQDKFVYENTVESDFYRYFKIYNSVGATDKFSIYASNSFETYDVAIQGRGFDAGEAPRIDTVTYTGIAETPRDTYIRTNSTGTYITVTAPLDSVQHYGDAALVTINGVALSSYHEFGNVAFLEVAQGRVVLEEGASLTQMHFLYNEEDDQFDEIVVAYAPEVVLPTFSRDIVENIKAEGTLVVELQNNIEPEEADSSFVWLFQQGLVDQIRVSDSKEEAGDITAVDDRIDQKTYKAADDIANTLRDGSQATPQQIATGTVPVADIVESGLVESVKEEKAETIINEKQNEELQDNAARIRGMGFESINDAIENAIPGDTIVVMKDATTEIKAHGDNLTIDLNSHTITAPYGKSALTAYESESITVKNGTLNGYIRVGEHERAIVRWKVENDKVTKTRDIGWHPLAPVENLVLQNLNVTSNQDYLLYFTNVEDDLTRLGGDVLYGKYIYKVNEDLKNDSVHAGYTTHADWTAHNMDQFFTACSAKDFVTFKGGSYTANKLNGNIVEGLIGVDSGTFSFPTAARYNDNQVMVGDNAHHYVTPATAPQSFMAKVGNVYFAFEGGADAAIAYSQSGDTVLLRESSSAAKTLGKDEILTVICEGENVAWTGAAPADGYDLVSEVDENDENMMHYSTASKKEAIIYEGVNSGAEYKNGAAGKPVRIECATLIEAIDEVPNVTSNSNCGRGTTIKLMADVVIDAKRGTYNSVDYGIYWQAQSVLDFNGHTITYHGSGAAILISAKSGSGGATTVFTDTSPSQTGGIIADGNGAYCICKKNTGTEVVIIDGGNYISQNGTAIRVDNSTTMTIDHGTYSGADYWLEKDKDNAKGITITGNGTYLPSVDKINETSSSPFSCLAEGTMIRMADGSLKDVAQIVAGDELMVFDHMTGELSTSTVVFNDAEECTIYNVLSLSFSNGQVVEIVDEHGFFDMDLMKYVYIDEYNYADFVGHSFYTTNGSATLTAASLSEKECALYSPVTAGNLNLFVGDLLSMPGGVEGLFNIFAYDADLSYNEALMAEDIAAYGLLDYSYFEDLIPYEIYEAFNGRYLGVAMGKGILDEETLLLYIERYSCYWN